MTRREVWRQAHQSRVTQTRHIDRDADHLNAHLEGKAGTAAPGFTLTMKGAVFDVSDHETYRSRQLPSWPGPLGRSPSSYGPGFEAGHEPILQP